MRSGGLDQPLALAQAPAWISTPEARIQLGREIKIVSKQQLRPEVAENAQWLIRQCAIAITRSGLLAPPAQLYRPTRDILAAFAALNLEGLLAAEENPDGITELIAEFQPDSMLNVLERVAKEDFEQLWTEQKDLLLALIDWFVDHRKHLLTDDLLKRRLKQLPIWPSEQAVHPLDDLVVAGSFQDPLQLASVLSNAVYRSRRDFMSNLGFRWLNISTYAQHLIPAAFAQRKVSAPVCDTLVLILADHVGTLRDSQTVRDALQRCPLVACNDGRYRAPKEVYFENDALADGFADLPVALIPAERQESVTHLYEWLGVAHEPRLSHVVMRIEQIVGSPPDPERRQAIAELFKHLSSRKIVADDPAIDALRTVRWLPARNDEGRWFAPSEIYAVYRDYLFSTQARFLRLEPHLQRSASALIELLGIKSNPSTLQVVKHLQTYADRSLPVNREVYTFLNDHAQDLEIERLQSAPCLLLNNDRYVFPSQVFWEEHGFGRYRYRLDSNYRSYDRLLKRLGVRERPEPSDAIAVMTEIAQAFQQAQTPLDNETYDVLIGCWRQLGAALEHGKIAQSYLTKLRAQQMIPTEDRLLRPPAEMFLEDRPGIAERLHTFNKAQNFRKQHTIVRIVGAWQAMEAAGVRPLSEAVKVTLIECDDRVPANDLQQKLSERKILIRRVIEAHASDDQQWDLSLLDTLRVDGVSRLALDYSIRTAESSWLSGPEEVAAYFDTDFKVLYVQRQSNRLWLALARELAFALSLEGESVRLAASLKEILSAENFEMAAGALNELGYAQLVDATSADVAADTVGLGGETAPDDAPSVADPATSSTGTPAVPTGTAAGTSNSASGVKPTPTPSPDGQAHVAPGNPPVPPSTSVGAAGAAPGARSSGGGRTDHAVETSGAGTADRTRGTNAGSSDRERGRLRTYVAPTREEDARKRTEPSSHLSAVDRAGIARVIQFEKAAGRFAVEMPHENPGYDIESRDAGGTVLRYIEVKSISGNWDSLGVGLSYRQFSEAHVYGEQFWLYVVERAEQPDAQVYAIQDPARRVNQFFYDDGWRSVADDQAVA